ncbi:MAG: hypothetical protein ACRDQA_09210 [Nocardioidaceae bacterium]
MGTSATVWNEDDGERLYVQGGDESTRTQVDVQPTDTIAGELAALARCIRDGQRPETGGVEGLEAVAVLQAIAASAASGLPANVRDFRG